MLAQPITSTLHSLNRNDRLLIEGDRIWHLKSGALDLFAVYQGYRRYLFSLKPGELLFPSAFDAAGSTCQLVAQAVQDVVLEPFSQNDFQIWMQQNSETAILGIEGWVTRLSGVATNLMPTALPTPILGSGILDQGEVFQPPQGQVSWIRLCHGAATLLNEADLVLTPDLGWIPLPGSLWLQATEVVELDRCHHEFIFSTKTFVMGVFQLQQRLVQLLTTRIQHEQREELNRLYERERINQDAIRKTSAEFIKVFRPAKQKRTLPESPSLPKLAVAEDFNTALLMATGAVGHALGITIHVPGESADRWRSQNWLDAIARASHLRIRRITLRDDWWKQDLGPMVAYQLEDGRPIALLPLSESSYEMYDPFTQSRTRCDRTLAQQLSTTAHTFYRSLPTIVYPVDLLRFALRGHSRELLIVLMVGVATTLLGMVTPQATALLVSQAIPDANHQLLWQMALGLIAVAFGSTLFQMTQGFALIRLETFADSTTQAAIWDRLLKLQPSFFRQYAIGDLSSRVSAISQIRQRLGTTLLKSLFSGIFSFSIWVYCSITVCP